MRVHIVRGYVGKIALVLFLVLAAVVVLILRWPPALGVDLGGGEVLDYAVADGRRPSDEEMGRLIGAIGRRIDPSGVKGITIQRLGADRLRIVLPRMSPPDVARLEGVIPRPGTLEFRILANTHDHPELIERARKEESAVLRDALGDVEAWWVPVAPAAESELVGYQEIATRPIGGKSPRQVLVVADPHDITEAHVARAWAGADPEGRPYVNFALDGTGAQRMARFTGEHLPDQAQKFSRKLGVILDGKLISAPPIERTVREEDQINGGFTQDQVRDLVDVLNGSSLPVPLDSKPVQRLRIGPTVARHTQALAEGVILVGLALLLVGLCVVYGYAGMIGAIGMLLVLLGLMAVMTLVRAAFSLAALAGLGLALAIALDANVLVLERLREELYQRQSPLRAAIRNAFGRAQSAILDGHLIMLLVASILFLVGTAEVKGFAVPLWLGVAMSLFATLFALRTALDMAEKSHWIDKLRMRRLVGAAEFDLLRRRCVAPAVSLVLMAAGLAAALGRGQGLLGLDLAGGSTLQTQASGAQDQWFKVRQALASLSDARIAEVIGPDDVKPGQHLLVDLPSEPGTDAQRHLAQVKGRLEKQFGQIGFSGATTIGPAVTESALLRALAAWTISLAVAAGYLWWRFARPAFAISALLAVIHDVLVVLAAIAISGYAAKVLGFLLLAGFRIGVPTAAAMLAVIGYSLYDKTVLFDRIREVRGKSPILTAEMINAGLRQALGRMLPTYSGVVLIVSFLFFLRAPELQGFAFALLVGAVAATYSSIYIAPPLLLWMTGLARP